MEISGSVAERNDGPGVFAFGNALSVTTSRADANGEQGFLLAPVDEAGSLVLQDVAADSNEGEGVVAFPSVPTLRFSQAILEGVSTIANLSLGMVVAADQVAATNLTARNNDGSGASLVGHEITVEGAIVELNGNFGLAVATMGAGATFALTGVTATANQFGTVVQPIDPEVLGTGILFGVVATGSQELGIAVFAERLTAAVVTAAANGGAGAVFFVTQTLDATTVSATGNAGIGFGAAGTSGSELNIESSVATGNLTGILVNGSRVRLTGCTASGSGPIQGGPFDGVGFMVSADALEAENDFAIGNEIGWLFADVDTRALAQLAGEAMPRLPSFALDLGPPPDAPAGPAVPQGLAIRTSRTEANAVASMQVALRPEGRLTVGCSDFIGNGPAGLELSTDNAVTARANFWGDPSGPTHPGNPGGSGDIIRDAAAGAAGTVHFTPFLAAPATEGDCPVLATVEVPTLGPAGLALLVLAVAGAALAALRRKQ